MRGIKVMKFGGTSMGSPEAIRQVIDIVKRAGREARRAGALRPAAVVVSAMSGVTDQLIEIATRAANKDESYMVLLHELSRRHLDAGKALIRPRRRAQATRTLQSLLRDLEDIVGGVRLVHEISPRALDYIMSYGERLSAHLLTEALVDRGVSCEYLNARHVMTTNDAFGAASVDFKLTNPAIRAYFKKHPALQIVTGYIGSTSKNITTTLGRGGSDYSASIIGAALGAQSIEIWTDVPGVMTADPRKVIDARPIPEMSYAEASEMSYFGAKVIHPPTMQPALLKRIPIYIKNTFAPDARGTLIGPKTKSDDVLARGITSINDICVLQVQGSGMLGARGASARLFSALAERGINVILITQASSQNSITIAVAPRDGEPAKHAIEKEFSLERASKIIDDVKLERSLSIIAVVGEKLRHRTGIAGRLFRTLGKNGINVVAIAQGSSELNISVVVGKDDETRALRALHAAFFSPRNRFVNIFMVGTGLIGSTVLKQIAAQKAYLEREHGYVIKVHAIGNHRHTHFAAEGVAPGAWEKIIGRSRQKMNIGNFIREMKRLNIPDSVFVDCTASPDVADRYMEILSAGISIVTPNKIANSGPYPYYRALKEVAAEKSAKFLYETNVGAGLPVISTLNDLILSGDRILKIEAVLSGTLSHIFNEFTGARKFSEIVREAKELGYTEPDPRVDLSGQDVARKILILGREIGLPLELRDVQVQSLLSERARRAASLEKFFEILQKEDPIFEKKKRAAGKAGKVLRYVASLNRGGATVSLQAVDESHPFYALYGNDNVIAFFTERYKKTPLIIQGPGAGAEVTAAGVFADILRTAANAA